MSAIAYVLIQDRERTADLFHAACRAAGGDEDGTVFDHGDTVMVQANARDANVSVHYQRDIDRDGRPTVLYPKQNEADPPGGYALVLFSTPSFTDKDSLWRHHAGMVVKLAGWLDKRGVRWSWQFNEDPWIYGTVLADRVARS